MTEEVAKETTEEMNALMRYLHGHLPSIVEFGVKVLLALIFFFAGRILIKWVRRIVKRAFERSNADKGVGQFVDSMLKFSLYALLLVLIATNFGVDTASVAAVIASAGVAVGLALQGSLSNFAGGVLILLLKPFVVGDYIIEDNHGNEGTVKEIQLFYTKLTTVDNKTIVIPNGMLTNNSLTNVTARDERQLDLRIGVSYDADLQKAKALMLHILDGEEKIMRERDVLVFVDELGSDSVILGIRAWVPTVDYWTVRWRLLEEIKLQMDANGMEIPYRQIDVHAR